MKLVDSDIVMEPIRGSGPGGQHRNKKWTGIRLTHLPTGIVVQATERRSQSENRRIALERLEERIRKKFQRRKKRKATKPTKASKTRRLQSKRKVGEKKQARGRVRQD